MVWANLLLGVVIGAALTASPTIPTSTACTVIEINSGTCSVDASVGAADVTLIGTATAPGSGGGGPSKGAGHAGPKPPWTCQIFVEDRCLVRVPRPGPAAPVVQPITLRDIASFRPSPGVQFMEP